MSSTAQFDTAKQVRRRRRTERRIRLGAVAGLAVVVAAGLVFLIGFSPVFATREVTVEGTVRLQPDELRAAADVDDGVPLIRISQAQVADRVIAMPEVAQVTVSRKLPGTVQIVVTERVPVMAVDGVGRAEVVDATGARFAARGDEAETLPHAQVTNGDPGLFAEVAIVAGAVGPELRDRAQEFTASTRDDITLQIDNGPQIFFGSAEQAALKAQVAAALIDQGGKVIDVSAPGNPVVR